MYPRDLTIKTFDRSVRDVLEVQIAKNPQMFFTEVVPSIMNGNTLRIFLEQYDHATRELRTENEHLFDNSAVS